MCNLKFPVFCPAWLWLAVASSMLRVTTAEITIGPAVWTSNGPQDTTAAMSLPFPGRAPTASLFIRRATARRLGPFKWAPPPTAAGASYTFTTADIGELVFTCDVATHCENAAMIMTVTVAAAGGGGDTPTRAPVSRAPTVVDPHAEGYVWLAARDSSLRRLLSSLVPYFTAQGKTKGRDSL
jgi:hypothetical protein